MVKPPKTMQPEQVDLSKAGRKAGKAFQEDSFLNYMARKIDLQRQQFGQVALPPPPLPQSPQSPSPKPSSPSRAKSILKSPLSKQPNKRKVRFTEPDPKRKVTNARHADKTDVGSIIHKLEKRHGKLKTRRRHKSSMSKSRKRRRSSSDVTEDDGLLEESGNSSIQSSGEMMLKQEEERISSHQEDEKIPASGPLPLNQPSVASLTFNNDAEAKTVPHESDDEDDGESALTKTPITLTSQAGIRKSRPDLFFYGIAIKVNGYTDPDNETLKRMIQKHGGQFECYETQRVTHIIAEHLSTAKANIFKRQRNPTPVVSPKWIVDSIAQQCLLPYVKYLIEEVKDRGQQKGIKELFAAGGKAPSLLAKTTQQDSTMQSNAPSKLPPTSVRTNQEYSGESKSKISMNQNIDNAITEQTPKPYRPTVSNDGTKQNTDLPSKVDSAQAAVTKPPLKPQGKINDKLINGRIRTVGTDPNFVNSYFSSSRLSFIGSYKQRTANVSSPSKASRKDTAHLDRYVFHVDMDCFFASVALRNFPQYKDKPVVISHHGKKKDNVTGNIESEFAVSKKSTSECATCNYKAREFGIKKGMFLGRAKELCPDLIILNYDFDGYQEVSEQVSEIINRIAGEYFGSVENVSCDESYVELMLENHEQAATIAESIRTEILQVTDCSASVGVADNKFLAKLGTDRVKPNGSYVVTDYRTLLADLKLRDLPGIGWRSEPKLAAEGLTSVHDVWDLGSNASPVLGRVLGAANGKKICMYCQGKDDRSVEAAKRKTIGAECNYGVRFDGPYGIDHFMQCLADEVQKRMENVGVKGRQITLKVKQRKKGAKNPPKFLGHGSCHSLSRSMEIPGSRATCDAKVISRVGMSLLKELAIPLDDVRGMGIVMSKLSDEEKSTSTELTNWFTVENQKKAPLGENNFTSEHHDEQVNKSADEQDDSPTDVQNISALEILDEDDVSVVEIDDNMGVARDLRNDYDDNQSQNSVIEDEIGNSLTIREALTQIALPPLSQIRMSQVEELPTAMQLQIRSRIEQQGKEKADQSNDQEVIQIDNADPPSREANSKRNNRGGSASPAKARSAQRNSLSSNDLKYHRFRQTDVKEMFKLAAVEAGAEPTEISLEVFNQLPMDIKLQIVNGDSFARNFTDVARGTYLLSNKDHMNSAVSIDDSRTQENNKVSQGNYIDENNKFCAEATSDATKDNATQENSSDSTATNILGTEPPANLYEEDILPLKLFLNENSSLNPEAIQLVTEFLTICLQEGRSKDMVTMVRNIRKRGDGWSEDAVLSEIFQTLDKEYLQLHGAHLDRDWIMGTKKM